jgi:hypothetical protein
MLTAFRATARRFTPFAALLLVLAGGLAACTAVKESVEAVADASRGAMGKAAPGQGTTAGKKVALIGADAGQPGDPSGFPAHFRRHFQAQLEKECAGLQFDTAIAADLKEPPRIASGLLDGYALAVLGRRVGVGFFMVGTLMDVKLEQEPTGFWLWKDTRAWIRAVMRLEVVDSATGAKILDDSQKDAVEIDGLKYEELKQSQAIRLADFQPAVDRMFAKSARLLCKTLRERPWQAFIVGAEGGRIVLSAGSDSGLAAGRVLEVFGLGAAVVAKDGQRFVPIGEKLGEAAVSAVSRDSAQAVFERWESVRNGGTVRMKN